MRTHPFFTRLHEEYVDEVVGNLVGHGLCEIFIEIAAKQRAVEAQLQGALPEAELAGCTPLKIEMDVRQCQPATKCIAGSFDALPDLPGDQPFLSFIEFCGHLESLLSTV